VLENKTNAKSPERTTEGRCSKGLVRQTKIEVHSMSDQLCMAQAFLILKTNHSTPNLYNLNF